MILNGKLKSAFRAALPVFALAFLSGCFSIPFIGGGGKPKVVEAQQGEFDRTCVFVGYDDDHRPIVELRLVSQEVLPDKGLIVHTRLFPTANFRVRNIFRGLRSINYYPIERRFHRLELRHGRKGIKFKVTENLQVRDTKPLDADFEQSGARTLLPDTVGALKLKFQDVEDWEKMPADSLDSWYAVKTQYIREIEQIERRADLVSTYLRRQKQDDSKSFTQLDSVFITTNSTYVYLEKDVDSDILFTANVGDKFDYGVSDGIWVELPLPDTLKGSLQSFLDTRKTKALELLDRQRRLARTARGPVRSPETDIDTTDRFTGYVLDVMVQKHYQDAVGWEKLTLVDPVDVPLFAKVLRDRETARLARLDSIAKAYQDSVQAVADSVARVKALADSLGSPAVLKADSLRADSARTAAGAGKAAPANPPQQPSAGAAQAAADSLNPVSGSPGDTLKALQPPAADTESRPPWAGTGRGSGRRRQNPDADNPPADTSGRSEEKPGSDQPPGQDNP